MTRNAEWEGLLAAKLVMRRDLLKDPESAAATIRQAIIEADEEEARSREPTAAGKEQGSVGSPRPAKRSARGTAPPSGPVVSASKPGAANGLTERVNKVFDDGQPHRMRDLANQLGVTPRQMKRAVNRLFHEWKAIKHVGEKRSGTYVRAGSQRPKAKR